MVSFKRGNTRHKSDYLTIDLYKTYVKKRKDAKKSYVSMPIFTKVFKQFIDINMKKLIYDGYEFTLLKRVGSVFVIKRKTVIKIVDDKIQSRGLAVDWRATKALWIKKYGTDDPDKLMSIKNKKIIYNLNNHSDNYKYYFKWDKRICNIPNRYAYNIKIERKYKKELSDIIKTVGNYQCIETLY